jgi:hypothetical protein
MTTLLISGSHDASDVMLAQAREYVMQAKENGWTIICGDSPGVDLQVVNECERLNVHYMCYGLKDYSRNSALKYTRLDVDDYAARDRWMVDQADCVICITTPEGTRGTMDVYNYAVQCGKEYRLEKCE